MKDYKTEQLRNVVLLGHGGTGKTSLAEAALFASGAINRLGKVEDGTTASDYDPDEARRGISIDLALVPCEWKNCKINLIDTPGYADFVGQRIGAIRAADTAAVLVDAVGGVEVGTELVWAMAEKAGLARIIFVNRIDRENADYFRVLAQAQSIFGKKCVPLDIPIGSQESFAGVVDLIEQKAYMGEKATPAEMPAGVADQVATYREQLIEAVAETDDALINKYLEGEELTVDEIKGALRAAVASGAVAPVLVGSAAKNVAIPRLLDAAVSYLPSPAEAREVVAKDASGGEVKLKADPAGPLAVLVFKTSAERVGKITYLRVVSGTLNGDTQVWDVNRGTQERVGQLFALRGKNQENVSKLEAGDVGGVAKIEAITGDTLCLKEKPITLPAIEYPAPALSAAVTPKTRADLDKLGSALARIAEEDPTLAVRREPGTGETLLAGVGDLHLEVAAERMKRKFSVELELHQPKVPYKETITVPSAAEYTHKKQTGGHGQYARVTIQLEPTARGTGFEFGDKIVGGVVPKTYIPAVEKGVVEAISEGILAGFPVVDFKAMLVDGKEHPVDSSEMAFKLAGLQAFKKAAEGARPVLLEPIVNLKVTVPESNTGDVMSDLNGKRARVQGMSPADGMSVIEAQVPLAEVQRYATDLRSITQGRGYYSIEFSHYEEVPAHIAEKIVAEAKKAEA